MVWWRLGPSAAGAAAVGMGRSRWHSRSRALRRELVANRIAPARGVFEVAELEPLPAPVRRYLTLVLPEGQPMIAAAGVAQRGSFNLSETGAQWRPFTARQRIIPCRPGFHWDARIQMLPGLSVRVQDAYVAGSGSLYAAVLGLVPLLRLEGTDALARGELMRFLAETPWIPTALLPGGGLTWQVVDDSCARAVLSDGDLRVSLLFRFGSDGLVQSVYAEDRPRMVGGLPVPTPWEGRWLDYRRRDGLLVPARGEVAWIIDGVRRPYWRGEVRSIRHQRAPCESAR